MPRYRYKARDKEGREVKGWDRSEDEESLMNILHQKGLTVVSMDMVGEKVPGGWSLESMIPHNMSPFHVKIKAETLLVFVEQLSAMIDAGIPLLRALKGLSRETTNKKFKEVLELISRDISSGTSFSDALAKHPSIFDQLFVDLVKAGEATGKLELTMSQLLDYMESRSGIRGKIKSALVYPVIITLFSVIVILALSLWVIPKFKTIYGGMGEELPLPTRILIGTTESIQSHFWGGLLLTGIIGAALWGFIKTTRGRRIFDRIKLLIPVFGVIFQKNAFSIFSRTMGTLLSSGISVIQAIEMSCRSVNNKTIEEALLRTADRIGKGGGIGASFREEKIFPEMLIQMVASGEETGNLDSIIVKVSNFYDRQLDAFATAFTALIEPVLLFFIGSIIGVVVIAMFLPMIKMAGVMH